MKRIALVAVMCLLGAATWAQNYIPGEVLFKTRGMPSEANIHATIGGHRMHTFPNGAQRWHTAIPVMEAIEALRRRGDVEYAEPNHIVQADLVPNEALYSLQYALPKIHMPQAWDRLTGAPNYMVGIVDTGLRWSHPDIEVNVFVNSGENCGSTDPNIVCAQRTDGIDNDTNGYVDDVRGWDRVGSYGYNRAELTSPDGNPADENYHGTHVAGICCARGNNIIDMAGVNWGSKVVAVRVLDANGSGTAADVAEGFDYMTNNKLRGWPIVVVNASLGCQSSPIYGDCFSQTEYDAVVRMKNADIMLVAAAGNNGLDAEQGNPHYPADFNLANIISVANSNENDNRNSSSNYGAISVDLAAPGTNILSLSQGPSHRFCCSTSYLSGTSMSSPVVAGLIPLIKQLHPTWNYTSIRFKLQLSVDQLPQWNGIVAWGGRLNACKALDGTGC